MRNRQKQAYFRGQKWSGWPDSNRRPPDPQSGALTRLRYIPRGIRAAGSPDNITRGGLRPRAAQNLENTFTNVSRPRSDVSTAPPLPTQSP